MLAATVATILMQAGHEVTVLDNLCHAKRAELPAGAEFVDRRYCGSAEGGGAAARVEAGWGCCTLRR